MVSQITTPARVLVIGNFLSGRPGTRSAVEDLVANLRPLGCEFVCASRIRPGWLRSLDMLWTAVSRMRDYEVAVVDLYSGKAFLWADALSRLLQLLNRPFAFVLRGGELPVFAATRVRKMQQCLSRATVVCAPSGYLFQHMAPYRADMQLLPNAIDARLYEFRVRERPAANLVWLRAFHDIYNPQLAPQLVRILSATHNEVRLSMYGPDKGDGSLQATRTVACDSGVQDRIVFGGPLSKAHVRKALASGDIFLNTANVDNTPVSVIEAMACGLCIVSTNVGGIPFLLEDGIDALLVEPGDAAGMAVAVQRILTEPGLAGKLSTNARRKALSLDWTHIRPKWELLFQTLQQSRNSTSPLAAATGGAQQE